MDYKAKAKELIEKSKAALLELKQIKTLDDAAKVLPDVIKLVEGVGADEGLKGADKRELAVAIINELVDVPFLPEKLEEVLIGWGVDTTVHALNKLLGQDWFAQLA
ncbi:MAG: hypothetical protein PHP45_06825 [Elusimicrobiales bacterium]|nr:hypothetical protein [Elusimicrobiales bacterium]